MKKLLFSGCSFVAGDEIVWASYCKEQGRPGLDWKEFVANVGKSSLPEDSVEFWNNYRYNYRIKNNLTSMVAGHLNSEWVDISADGNSNDMIAFSTINYFLNLPVDERKNYHACIGWTTTARLMKFTKIAHCYYNLHINHLDKTKGDPVLEELNEYLEVAIGKSYDEDIFLNFTKNIIMLENFFIANNITYTFFKSLGTEFDTAPKVKVALLPPFVENRSTENITNHDNWLRFDNDYLPYMGGSWTSTILLSHEEMFVSKNNFHPNVAAAKRLSEMLKDKIISQNVGFN